MTANRIKYENCIVKKAIIKSNVDGEEVDLRKCVEVHYEESLFSDSIEVNFIIANRAGTVRGLTLAEGLPLVGTEDFELHLQDPKNNVIKVKLNVNKVIPIKKDTQQEQIGLALTSEEFIRNEERASAVVKRYDGKVSKHISDILSDNLGTEKELFIDETSNNYNFIGNVRKPLYTINWLAKKSIPISDGKKGQSAGFMFYETSEGYHFKSIDSLFAQDQVGSYIFSDTPDVLENTDQYDDEIVRMTTQNKIVANQKYRMGTFNTKLIAFNPYNCEYKIIEQDAFDTEDGTTHAGKKLPVLNEKFSAAPTRTTYVLKDTGTLPTGADPREQVKKHEEETFEVESILNQASRRYNQLSLGAVEIDIAPDYALHAGQCVFIDVPDTGGGSKDKFISGKYLIATCKHGIRAGKGVTKLKLVRDSFGRKGKPHSGSTMK
tara:strand:+ start:357 stop:1661 length:1305 start_codon:yes stop_codon:yes gene_type:complete